MTMPRKLTILYRGPLSSCNYGCVYCPFAKHRESDAEHQNDGRALEKFVHWIEEFKGPISVFFTPWGEALIRRRYQDAIARLTQLAHVEKIAIQTNASCRFEWTEQCDKSKLGLWVTYHPTQTTRADFLARCAQMQAHGVRFSVGVVGLKEHFEEIAAVRAALPREIYLWVNAYKRIEGYYADADTQFLSSIDSLFPFNNQRHSSLGRACDTGESVISVDGEGTIRRCHFVKTPLGNLYRDDLSAILRPRACPNLNCGCHIGYVHLPHLQLQKVYGEGLLERIPLTAR